MPHAMPGHKCTMERVQHVLLLVLSQSLAVRPEPACIGEYSLCADGSCSLGPCNVGCSKGQYLCPLYDASSPECVGSAATISTCRGIGGSHLDASLDVEARLARLLSTDANLSLEEMVSQLTSQSPAIDRLGIPAMNWLNDALHGVQTANATSKSTMFPDGCGLGAAWNPHTLREVGAVIATEARGWKNSMTLAGNRGQGSVWDNVGITLYTPNINTVRDPRWGRAMEVYGEDPEHMSRLAVEVVRGVQEGAEAVNEEASHVLLAAATCKHFIAYHQETFPADRSMLSLNITNREMWESYMPPFEACVREAGAAQVMCSFNLMNGVPTCADGGLLTEVLRNQWGFTGSVVGDYDAWQNMVDKNHYSATYPRAVADGLNAGMDQEGGGNTVVNLGNVTAAIEASWTSRDTVAQAFARLFRTRMALGLLDPPAGPHSPPAAFLQLTSKIAASPGHLHVARVAARESLCLYKNNGGALPLDASQLSDSKDVVVVGPQASVAGALFGGYSGWASRGNWGRSLLDAVSERLGHEAVYAPGCSVPRTVSTGRGDAPSGDTDLGVSCPTRDWFEPAFDAARTAKVVLVTLGLEFDNEHHHPSMTVERECWDRTSVELPANVSALILGLRKANPNATLVAVFIHGGTFALPPATLGAFDAILDAWYPGIEGGNAIVEALFGDYNPGGRTPVTWYRSDKQLPSPSANASYWLPPLGLTYRFFDNTRAVEGESPGPLIPFGFGLSYTEFRYASMELSSSRIGPCETLTIQARVENIGHRDGDEVVQVYVRQPNATVLVPRVRLAAFARVHIQRQSFAEVLLEVKPNTHVAVLDGSLYDSSRVVVESGWLEIFVGGGQPDFYTGGLTSKALVAASSPLNDCGAFEPAGVFQV